MIFLLGCHCHARHRCQHQAARDVIERHDVEAGRHGMFAHGGQSAAPAARRAFQDDPSVSPGAPARGAEGVIELVFTVDIDDPGEIGRFAIRRRRAGTQSQPRRINPRTNGRVRCPMTATCAAGGRWAIAITRSTMAALEASSDTVVDGGSTSATSAFSWYMICPSIDEPKT
jgi:hypothetical protein